MSQMTMFGEPEERVLTFAEIDQREADMEYAKAYNAMMSEVYGARGKSSKPKAPKPNDAMMSAWRAQMAKFTYA